jgi:hypothetical protein
MTQKMNKLSLPILLILLFAAFSCKKDDAAPASTFPTTPEAQSFDDAKSGGVYKGAIVGSTGTIKIVLQKGVKEIKITIDAVSKTLVTTDLDAWTSGEIVRNALFAADGWRNGNRRDGDFKHTRACRRRSDHIKGDIKSPGKIL